MKVKPQELLNILNVAGRLKTTTRHCYTEADRKESVADHTFRMALMAMLMGSEFPEADMNKVIRMCLIHDLGEAFTGDIPSFYKNSQDEDVEEDVLFNWVDTFPEPEREQWFALYEEMNALESEEAKIYKAIDRLEAVISHDESDLSTWLPLEFELNLTYGNENVAFSQYLTELKSEIDKMTHKVIEEYRADQS